MQARSPTDPHGHPKWRFWLVLWVGILSVVAGLLFWIRSSTSKPEFSVSSSQKPHPAPSISSAPVGTLDDAPAPTVRDTSGPPEPTAPPPLLPPDNLEIRKQVEENPHSAPTALLNFADQMAQRMEPALADPKQAQALFIELESCTLGTPESNLAIRSACAVNAYRLAQKYPQALGDAYQKLNIEMAPEIREITQQLRLAPPPGTR